MNARSEPAVYVKPRNAVAAAASSAVIARALVVPRIATRLVRDRPSVRRMVTIVTALATRTANGTGGTPLTIAGISTFRMTTAVKPRATRARTPRHPPTNTTAAAKMRPRIPSPGIRQWSLTSM